MPQAFGRLGADIEIRYMYGGRSDCKNGIPVIHHEYGLRTQGIMSHNNFDIFVLISICKLRRSAPYRSRSSELVY